MKSIKIILVIIQTLISFSLFAQAKCISGNCTNGKGVEQYSDGTKYSGNFLNSMRHGQGKYIWKSGEVYNGNWLKGKRYGYAKFTNLDGSIVEGNWKNDEFILQTGCIKGNCENGQGVYVYRDGHFYNGSFKNGLLHGDGRMFDANETLRYYGQYKYGQRSGIGDTYHPNGSMHFGGEFKNGVPYHGWVRNSTDIVKYDGTSAGDVVYDGFFNSNFEPHGFGVSYGKNEKVLFRGIWENGEPIEETDMHGNPVSNSSGFIDAVTIGAIIVGVIASLSSNNSDASSSDEVKIKNIKTRSSDQAKESNQTNRSIQEEPELQRKTHYVTTKDPVKCKNCSKDHMAQVYRVECNDEYYNYQDVYYCDTGGLLSGTGYFLIGSTTHFFSLEDVAKRMCR